ncbi:MAG: hypothetical protein HC921_21825 [Synechococcaceae cyanobacterium SM2_3_1]|nr:hypothetical protein [Synechococcaceae cyanobacterium SM2_3_1]
MFDLLLLQLLARVWVKEIRQALDQVSICDGNDLQLYPGRSAIHRYKLSRPMQALVNAGLIQPGSTHLDYGCGYGDDVTRLQRMGIQSWGWDPYWFPHTPKHPSDVVTCLFVLNGILNREERIAVLQECWALTKRYLVISGRVPPVFGGQWIPYGDGYISPHRKVFHAIGNMKAFQWFVESTLQVETHVMLVKPITLIIPRDTNQLVLDLLALACRRHIAGLNARIQLSTSGTTDQPVALLQS